MEEEKQEEKNICEKIIDSVENKITQIENEGIRQDNVDYLYKLVDIHKDLKNEDYWKEKIMRYRGNYSDNYSNYDDSYGRRMRDSRGRYMDGDSSYGRRGVPGTGRGRYRGDEYMGEMMDYYHEYRDGRENYGADDETMKSFKYMLKSFKDYYKHLKDEASNQEEVRMLDETAREMLDM